MVFIRKTFFLVVFTLLFLPLSQVHAGTYTATQDKTIIPVGVDTVVTISFNDMTADHLWTQGSIYRTDTGTYIKDCDSDMFDTSPQGHTCYLSNGTAQTGDHWVTLTLRSDTATTFPVGGGLLEADVGYTYFALDDFVFYPGTIGSNVKSSLNTGVASFSASALSQISGLIPLALGVLMSVLLVFWTIGKFKRLAFTEEYKNTMGGKVPDQYYDQAKGGVTYVSNGKFVSRQEYYQALRDDYEKEYKRSPKFRSDMRQAQKENWDDYEYREHGYT